MYIRKAVMSDSEAMFKLIEKHAVQGQLLHRTRQSIYEHLQCFHVAINNNEVVGVVSLHILDFDLAEIRSLVVSSEVALIGIGKSLVQTIIEETKQLGINRLIALTYQDVFFHKCGFSIVERETLTQKIWKDCIHCTKINSCDEIAMQINVGE